MSEPLPDPRTVLETSSTHTTSGFLSFSPTPAEEELMMFFIGLRFFDEKEQQRILEYMKTIKMRSAQPKGQENNGI